MLAFFMKNTPLCDECAYLRVFYLIQHLDNTKNTLKNSVSP